MNNLLKSYFEQFVQLRQRDINRIYPAVKEFIETLLEECNRLDDDISKAPIYVGSYWQGLKVGKPNEYDVCVQFDTDIFARNRYTQQEYRLRHKTTREILWEDKVLKEDNDKYELVKTPGKRVFPFLVRQHLKKVMCLALETMCIRGKINSI